MDTVWHVITARVQKDLGVWGYRCACGWDTFNRTDWTLTSVARHVVENQFDARGGKKNAR